MTLARLAIMLAVAAATTVHAGNGRAQEPEYAADLLRFSEILGAVAYLDTLCGEAESDVWRNQMQALLDAQDFPPEDRRKYVDVYNRGHRTFGTVHRVCTPDTRAILREYMGEGAELAERLEQRFGRGSG